MSSSPHRVVLLGASNLGFGLSRVISLAEADTDGPLDVLVAAGFGRSFGRRSFFLWRGLPAIRSCGMWAALDQGPSGGRGLITDVGNDILYGEEPHTILDWVADCIDRLQARGIEPILTDLPRDSVLHMSRLQRWLVQGVLFPWVGVDIETAKKKVVAVSDGLRGIAAQRGLSLQEHRSEWYGFDPIHMRRRGQKAWPEILTTWGGGAQATPSHALRRAVRRARPVDYAMFGMRRTGRPAEWPGGRIRLY